MESGSFEELKIELESMFERIAKKENILENITRLTQLQQEIGLSAPSQLRHYLEKLQSGGYTSETWRQVFFAHRLQAKPKISVKK